MLATGFTFQGQLIRRPLVALQDGPAPSGEAAAVAPEAEA
jgi:hypothetical protein